MKICTKKNFLYIFRGFNTRIFSDFNKIAHCGKCMKVNSDPLQFSGSWGNGVKCV